MNRSGRTETTWARAIVEVMLDAIMDGAIEAIMVALAAAIIIIALPVMLATAAAEQGVMPGPMLRAGSQAPG